MERCAHAAGLNKSAGKVNWTKGFLGVGVGTHMATGRYFL